MPSASIRDVADPWAFKKCINKISFFISNNISNNFCTVSMWISVLGTNSWAGMIAGIGPDYIM